MIDPEQERRRLEDHYSRQIDGRLEQVASQAYELGDLARQVLREELSRRGLSTELTEVRPIQPTIQKKQTKKPVAGPQPGDPPPEPPAVEEPADGEVEFREMVTIRQFRDLPEALFAKGSLESVGIECALVDDNMVRLDWFISNLLGGVKLQVKAEDAVLAAEVLDQPIPADVELSDGDRYEQPRCPKCGSLDINFRETHPGTYAALFVNLPIPLHRRAWRCHSCGVEWEEIPDQSDSTESASS